MELGWKLCVKCQRKTSKALKCPLENPLKKGNKKEAYTNLLNHVKQFQDIDSLLVIVKFGCDETAENWEFHCASWHKSCYTKFSSCKVERAKLKRKRSSGSTETSSRGKRQRLNSEVCFLCEKGAREDDGDLRLGYIIDYTYTTFLMPLDKKVKLASFQENMLNLATRQYFLVFAEVYGKLNSFTLLYLPPGCFLVRRVWPYHTPLASPRAVPVG